MPAIAFIALATTYADTLREFASWFPEGTCDLFVHVDKKFDRKPFDALERAFVLDQRVDVKWAGFSMIEAEVALLRTARSNGPYANYVLISDDTLPTRPAHEILAKIGEPFERIDIRPVEHPDMLARYNQFYWTDNRILSPKYAPIFQKGAGPDDVPYLEQFIAAIKKGKKPIEKLYSGSQWWALTDEAVAYFLQIYETDEAMLESFRHSAIPDEIYIQTVIGSSPFRQRSKPSPMFADFSRSPKPYVFTSADELDMPLASDKLFLRKARLPLNAIASRIKTS